MIWAGKKVGVREENNRAGEHGVHQLPSYPDAMALAVEFQYVGAG